MRRTHRITAGIGSLMLAAAGAVTTVVATASPATAAITPQVLITSVSTTGNGFAFAGAASGTGNALAVAPPANSTLVNGVVFFSSATGPTNPVGADSPYTFSNGTTTVVLPDSSVTSDTVGGRIVGQALLPPGFVGSNAGATFTGTVNGGTVNRWRFAAIYTTTGATTTKRVALVGDPTAVPGGSTGTPLDAASPLTPAAVTTAQVGGVIESVAGSGGGNARQVRVDSSPPATTGTVVSILSGAFAASGTNATWASGATTATGNFLAGSSGADVGLAYALSYVPPATAPAAPTIGLATAGNGNVSVAFSANGDGGSPITGFTATCTGSGGPFPGTNTVSPIAVTVPNGTAVTCTVHATNINGNSAESAASNSVTPSTVPDAPTMDIADFGDGIVDVHFIPPGNNGGSAITGFTATCTGTGGPFTGTNTASPINVLVTNGVAVTCTVHATNINGNSAESAASNSVTPSTVPDAPTIGTATANDGSVDVSFTGPAFNGGSTITGFTATCTGTGGPFTGTNTASPINVLVTNGTAVTCTVHATNINGNSAESAATSSVTPSGVPDAPTIGTATANDGSVDVSFTGPAFNGGSTITGFTATCTGTGGPFTGTNTASPINVLVTNGVAVTCTVHATNINGNSAESAASNSVTPSTVPDAPTIGTATANDGSVDVSFTGPAFNGGSTITGFTATCTGTGGPFTGTNTASPINVLVTNGVAVTCTVHATNINGNSAESAATSSVTPSGVPDAPTIGTATANDGSVDVSFTGPAFNGGSTITGFTATCTGTGGPFTGTNTASPINVLVTNGTAVTCTVHATNINGNSAESAATSSVTPSGVPDAPTIGTATANDGSVDVSFTGPAFNGGSTITGFTATCTGTGGPFTGTNTASPINVLVTNGTAVTCTVHATNINGNSAESAATSSVTPSGVPDAPTIGTATANDGSVDVSFTGPAFNGGSTITGFTATCTGTGGPFTGTNTAAPINVVVTNGTAVTCTVHATNINGNSAESAASNSVTPSGVPDAPTIGTATANDGSVDVSFTGPAFNGGSTITGYTATCTGTGGPFTNSGAVSPINVIVPNGTAVTCTVHATNINGNSAESAATSSVTPSGVPDAPTIGSATANDGSVDVTFTGPAFNGGSTITGYTATCSGTGGPFTGTNTAAPINVVVPNGTAVTCTVHATNINGNSAESAASNSVTPSGVPDAPTIGTATANDGSVDVSFTGPAFNGGSTITGYTATCTGTGGPFTNSGAVSPINVIVPNGTAVTCTVHATNINGNSAESAATSSVTPSGVPDAPTIGSATANDGSVDVTFTGPAFNGGSTITGYTATCSGTGGPFTGTNTAAPINVVVPNGTAVTCTVHATNLNGNSLESAASNSETPTATGTTPGAPSIDGITPSASGVASVRFLPPTSSGSSPITGYEAKCGLKTKAGTSSPITLKGLANGVSVQCTVRARNLSGFGPYSAPRAFVPGVPRGPFNITGGPGPVTGSVVVSWPAAQANGAPITSYVVKCVPWTASLPARTVFVLGSARSAQLNNLTPGQQHTCSVVAVNSRGLGNSQDAQPVGTIKPKS